MSTVSYHHARNDKVTAQLASGKQQCQQRQHVGGKILNFYEQFNTDDDDDDVDYAYVSPACLSLPPFA